MTDLTREQAREQIARALARVGPGEDWPTNVDLGGHAILGTRDDEYRWAMQQDADAALTVLWPVVEGLRAELDEARDEHHTMDELYLYRALYHAHAANEWARHGTFPVVKSRVHSDGEPCFGGGWFIVVATLPTGQASNHYPDEQWGWFDVPEVNLPPEYDGHTPAEAAERIRAALDEPPTGLHAEVERLRAELAHAHTVIARHVEPLRKPCRPEAGDCCAGSAHTWQPSQSSMLPGRVDRNTHSDALCGDLSHHAPGSGVAAPDDRTERD